MNSFKLSVESLYDGEEIHKHRTLTIRDGIIESITACDSDEEIKAGMLIPGFMDVQVNGGGGYLFNADPCLGVIEKIGKAHAQFGTTGWLPTLVTDSYQQMSAAADAIAEVRANNTTGVLGIHFEGPFLSLEKKGVHCKTFIRNISDKELALFSRPELGCVMLTIAPENVPASQIKELVDSGVIVSIGHSAATFEQAVAAVKAGATGFTHLYNAMSPLTSREPGVVGAALVSDNTFSGIIMDGIHVHPGAAKIALNSRTKLVLITDAMPLVGTIDREFEFFGQSITRKDDRLTDSEGRLAGSTLDMSSAVINASALLEIEFLQAVDLATKNPADYLGLGSKYGKIKANYRASMLLLDKDKNIQSSWIDGRKTI